MTLTNLNSHEISNVGAIKLSFPLILTACLTFLLNLAFAWPGIMTWDSNNQYMQAVSGQYDDWFPPIMAVLWRALLALAPWGTGLLTLHLALWWGGIALIATALCCSNHRIAGWMTLAVGALPVLVLLNSFILKDVGLTAAILFAFSLVFYHRTLHKKISVLTWLAISILFLYACLVRQNGVFAVAPLIFYAARPSLSKRLVLLLCSCLIVTLFAIAVFGPINRHVFHAKDGLAKRSLILFDTTGIAYWSRDASVFRRAINPPLEVIDSCYDSALWDKLGQSPCQPVIEQQYVSATTMVMALMKHPMSYLQHRIVHFNRELFLWTSSDHWEFDDNNRLTGQPVGKYDQLQRDALRFWDSIPFFSPAFALTLLITIFLVTLRFRQADLDEIHSAVFFLSVSAILYTLGFTFIGVANIYRYYEYPVLACALVLLMYFSTYKTRSINQNKIAIWTALIFGSSVLLITSVARLSL